MESVINNYRQHDATDSDEVGVLVIIIFTAIGWVVSVVEKIYCKTKFTRVPLLSFCELYEL